MQSSIASPNIASPNLAFAEGKALAFPAIGLTGRKEAMPFFPRLLQLCSILREEIIWACSKCWERHESRSSKYPINHGEKILLSGPISNTSCSVLDELLAGFETASEV